MQTSTRAAVRRTCGLAPIIGAAVVALGNRAAFAQWVGFDAGRGTLPSEQCFTVVAEPPPPTPPWVADGLIGLNTFPTRQPTYVWQRLDVPVDLGVGIVIEARVSVIASEASFSSGSDWPRYGFSIVATDPDGRYVDLSLAGDRLCFRTDPYIGAGGPSCQVIPFPVAGPERTYRIEVTPSQARLLIDGLEAITLPAGSPGMATTPRSEVWIGDPTVWAASDTRTRWFRFTGVGPSAPPCGCASGWITDPAWPFDGPVDHAMVWDPDGAGPAGQELVAVGRFGNVGPVAAPGIARWDGLDWSALGTGIAGEYVDSLAVYRGELIVGGYFTEAGGVPANNIAAWDGHSWRALGDGTNGRVFAMTVYQGSLYVGGTFQEAGSQHAPDIARWDGTVWWPVGLGLGGSVVALTVHDNELIAGGIFWWKVMAWNGASWRMLGPDGLGYELLGFVTSLETYDGDLFAGGFFHTDHGSVADGIARWDGVQWNQMVGTGPDDPNGIIAGLRSYGGRLFVAGDFGHIGGVQAPLIASWDGLAWGPVDGGLQGTGELFGRALAEYRGELFVGGLFAQAGGLPAGNWARWADAAAPWVVEHPASGALPAEATLILSATPASGHSGVAYQWRRDGTPLADGQACLGGIVSGAAGTLPSPTDGTPAVLIITGVQPGDAGEYDVEFFNPCGSALSYPASVRIIGGHCPADLIEDGLVEFSDYLEFLNFYDTLDLRADFNCDGMIDFSDYLEFLNYYDAGC